MVLVVKVGVVPNTSAPEPVSSVTAAARLALDGVPRKVATPVPREVMPVPPLATGSVPVTPVVRGSPVTLVITPLVGVPSKGVTNVGLVDNTLLPLPVEVVTPVPPLATANVPPKVNVPVVVIGPPVSVSPVVPPEPLTEVTLPLPLLLKVVQSVLVR